MLAALNATIEDAARSEESTDLTEIARATMYAQISIAQSLAAIAASLAAPNERAELEDERVTVAEAAEQLHCDPETIRHLIRDGLLRASKRANQWRIPTAELDRFRR